MSSRRTAENNTPRPADSYRAARRAKMIALAKMRRKSARSDAQANPPAQTARQYAERMGWTGARAAARRLRQRKAA